jgi:hypothetical protein
LDEEPNWLLSRLKGWPLVGRLAEVPKDSLREARDEIASATFFGTMPFWFLPIVGWFIFLQHPSVWTSIKNGELFIYAASLVGPLAYIITKRHGRFKVPKRDDGDEETPLSYPFPYGRSSSYLACIICVLSGAIFSIQRMRDTEVFSKVAFINEGGLVWLSVIVFLLSSLLLFCVIAYRNMLESLDRKHSDIITNSLPTQEQTLFEEWLERKGS